MEKIGLYFVCICAKSGLYFVFNTNFFLPAVLCQKETFVSKKIYYSLLSYKVKVIHIGRFGFISTEQSFLCDSYMLQYKYMNVKFAPPNEFTLDSFLYDNYFNQSR